MSRFDDTIERKPGRVYRPNDETTQYWLRDDGKVFYLGYPVRGAHAPTFRFYLGAFAKDHRHGYSGSRRLRGSDGPSFRALNYCFAADKATVWTLHGALKDADVTSFTVCDDGVLSRYRVLRSPCGFGKDRFRVYYYDRQGKPRWVRKADPESFESLNDGIYGKDGQHVFCRFSVVAGARLEHWRLVGGHYSRDDRHVYYDGRRLAGVDVESFEVVRAESGLQLAKDRSRFYWCANVIDAAKYDELVAEPA